MSGDEVIVLVFCLGVCAGCLLLALFGTFQPKNLRASALPWRWVALGWLMAELCLLAVLKFWSSFDVKDSPTYLFFYMIMGSAWTALAFKLLRFVDLRFGEDVLERGNRAAAFAQGGAVLGIMLGFSGGNIGDGPGWWCVVCCAFLATAALFIVWLLVELFTGWSYLITVERHEGSGILAGGFFVAGGVIAGRSVAGNWVSLDATLGDFYKNIWPLFVLGIVAVVMQKLLLSLDGKKLYSPEVAILLAFFFVSLAGAALKILGPVS